MPRRNDKQTYWIYLLASRKNGTLYTGVTNSLERRTWQHQHPNDADNAFTAKYGVTQLVYFESFRDVRDAIAREKQIKGGSRKKKIALIERANPDWLDLSSHGFDQP